MADTLVGQHHLHQRLAQFQRQQQQQQQQQKHEQQQQGKRQRPQKQQQQQQQQHNAATLKFTAVKVDVSALTQLCQTKAFVISSQTTSRELARMVLQKLRLDVNSRPEDGHSPTSTCLLATPHGAKEKRALAGDERVLGLMGGRHKKTMTLELVPASAAHTPESSNESDQDKFVFRGPDNPRRTSIPPVKADDVLDSIRAGNLKEAAKHGTTLPGYQCKSDVAYNNNNHANGSRFVTSTPNPDAHDSIASTVDSGFIIHYEPCNDGASVFSDSVGVAPLSSQGARMRSRSFEIARDNGNRLLDDSSGNASDSGMVLLNHNNMMATASQFTTNGSRSMNHGYADVQNDTETQSLPDYPYRPNLKDGFQILQSKHSAWTPFSRHISESLIQTDSGKETYRSTVSSSVPDISGAGCWTPGENKPGATFTRRRSLPKLSLSQEQLEEKKRSVTDLFASKLKDFIQKAKAAKHSNADGTRSRRYDHVRASRRSRMGQPKDDDAISVTSEEVAEILSCASPLKPYEEDEEDLSPESLPEDKIHPVTDSNDLKPVTPFNTFHALNEPPVSPVSRTNDPKQGRGNLGDFVEESIRNFISTSSDTSSEHREQIGKRRSSESSGGGARGSLVAEGADTGQPLPTSPEDAPVAKVAARGVPLFTLLTTHILAPVMVRRNREMAPHKSIGVRLCDVTYAKSIRHVIRHWASNSRVFTVDPALSERMLVAIGGLDRRTTVILAGKLFRGDIIVEINGKSAIQMSARDVISRMVSSAVVSLVVARSRLNVERGQSP